MRNFASLLPTPNATATSRLHKADLHLLAVFMTVAQCGGFAAAQVALNVSQSTISRKIGDLERGLGMRLCQRGRAGFHLTDKGRVVYEACEHLSTALESFRTTVGALHGELVGELSIAVIDNWATERGYRCTIDRRKAASLMRTLVGCESTALESIVYTMPSASGAAPASAPAGGDDTLARYDDNGNGRIAFAEARRHGIAPVPRSRPVSRFMRDAEPVNDFETLAIAIY